MSESIERNDQLDSNSGATLTHRPYLYWYSLCLTSFGVVIFFVYRLLTEYSLDQQRGFAPITTVWAMHVCMGLCGAGAVCVLLPAWRGWDRRRLAWGAAIGVVAYLMVGLAPKTTRILYDEHIYMQIGQTLAHTGRAEYASYAKAEYGDFMLLQGETNKQPNGHPYYLSLFFRVFGANENTAHFATRLATALTAVLIYWAVLLFPWHVPRHTALCAGFAYPLIPLVLWWGHTAAVEPTTAFTSVGALVAVLVFVRSASAAPVERVGAASLMAGCLAYASYFRPETLYVYPLALAVLLCADRRLLFDKLTWSGFLMAFTATLPELLQLWSVRDEKWGATDGRRFDLSFLTKNFESNFGYFIDGQWFPICLTLLAIIGLLWGLVMSRKQGATMFVWLGLTSGIYLLFYAGGYWYGASNRYAVISSPVVAAYIGIGAAFLLEKGLKRPFLLGAGTVVLALNWLSVASMIPHTKREATEARADILWVRETAKILPTGSLVISTNPCVWNLNGRNAGQFHATENLVRTEMNELVRQYPGGIYLHWEYWVNTTPDFAATWKEILILTKARLAYRGTTEDKEYGLFRIDTPYARATYGGSSVIEQRCPDIDAVAREVVGAPPLTPEEAFEKPVVDVHIPIR